MDLHAGAVAGAVQQRTGDRHCRLLADLQGTDCIHTARRSLRQTRRNYARDAAVG